MSHSMSAKSFCQYFPALAREPKAPKECSLCLTVRMGRRKQIVHNLLSIDLKVFSVRHAHLEAAG
jgi:hypothetical protein